MKRTTDHGPRCTCSGGEHGPSTHRGAAHFTRCNHSTLKATTKRYQRQTFRRLPGTRGYTRILDGDA
jgi:hypothetical protein